MTQIHEQPELDCSPGAKMLIERMQTNPEDFNYQGKLRGIYDTTRLSPRDTKALNEAHDRYIKEPELMVAVLEALTRQPEQDETVKFKTQGRYTTAACVVDPRAIYGTAPIKGEGQSVWYDANTDQFRVQEMEMRMHIAEHEYHAKRLLEAQRKRQLSWPDKLKGTF